MSRKSNLEALFGADPPRAKLSADNSSDKSMPSAQQKLSADNPELGKRTRSGAIRALGDALGDLKSRASLAEEIEAGSHVVELDTDSIDRSFVADRLADATDASLAALVESIRESGQQVPILVRPHPEKLGRYQTAYGHRRVQATAALGIKVRATIRPLSDAELVVAQGKENLDRRELSYIERAFFAMRLEERSFPREVICAAMATDLPSVSRFVTVARTVPEDLALTIGPASKAGRRRWLDLVEGIEKFGRERIDPVISEASFARLSSDERFVAVLRAVTASPSPTLPTPIPQLDEQDRKLIRVGRAGGRLNLSVDDKLEPAFGEYLLSRLPEILAAYRAGKE